MVSAANRLNSYIYAGYRVLKLLSEDPANYPDAPREVRYVLVYKWMDALKVNPFICNRFTYVPIDRSIGTHRASAGFWSRKRASHTRATSRLTPHGTFVFPSPATHPDRIHNNTNHPHLFSCVTQHRRHQDGHDRGDQRAAGAERGAVRAGHHGGLP